MAVESKKMWSLAGGVTVVAEAAGSSSKVTVSLGEKKQAQTVPASLKVVSTRVAGSSSGKVKSPAVDERPEYTVAMDAKDFEGMASAVFSAMPNKLDGERRALQQRNPHKDAIDVKAFSDDEVKEGSACYKAVSAFWEKMEKAHPVKK